ncbi:helix-turn-helix transcriptional regulator [Rhizobium ruizarguesonis]|uniref:helix-turn-helix transcriptional regulator n=1 Tax=Rhizobium ruizarguesonis TaxID=2081791 RepID=UPI0018D554A6|nr:hypothetical protein [Rhizobium ruizarguesonis]
MTVPPRLIGRKEAAEYCGISPTCFSLWVSTHKMPPAIPGTRMWDKRAIDAKLDEISGLVSSAPEDPFDKWERENRSGRSSGRDTLAEWRAGKEKRRAKYRPQMGLEYRLESILVYMAAHPECDTAASIPNAGPAMLQTLQKAGAVRLVGTMQEALRYALTEEGNAEAARIKKWRSLAP